MKEITDEQATQAKRIIDDYNNKYQASIKNLAKHRVPCDKYDSISIAGRELDVEGSEIVFPPYGQSFTTNIIDHVTIKTNGTDKIKKSSTDKNRGQE